MITDILTTQINLSKKKEFLFNNCNILNLSHFLSIMEVNKQRVLGL